MRRLLAALLLVAATGLAALDLDPPMEVYETSSEFGLRRNPWGGARDKFHGGVDLTAPPGTPVLAAAEGYVVELWPPPNGYYKGHPVYGGMILIQHTETAFTLYGHLSEVTVEEGWYVWKGRQIGVIGNTGISTGTHLHFEILVRPAIPPTREPVRTDPIMEMARRFHQEYRARQFEERNATR